MKNADKQTIKKEVLNIYNQFMPNFYKTYRQYDPIIIRQLCAQTILEHVFTKNADALRDKRRRRIIKRAKREAVKTIEIKKELEEFCQI